MQKRCPSQIPGLAHVLSMCMLSSVLAFHAVYAPPAADVLNFVDVFLPAGGDEDMVGANATYGPLRSKAGTGSNAYMLVYVRSADWSRIMCPVVKEDIAEHLRVRLEQEHAEKEERARMKQDAHQFATLRIATEDDLSAQVCAKLYVYHCVHTSATWVTSCCVTFLYHMSCCSEWVLSLHMTLICRHTVPALWLLLTL